MSEYRYPVEIVHLFVSPGHNYFGRSPEGGIGDHPTEDRDEIELIAGRGIVGDRFFDKGHDFDGHVTFFASEAREGADYAKLRRNIVTRGLPGTALIGHTFELVPRVEGALPLRFSGTKHCAPCRWLDHAMGEGTMADLRGRGGLRAQVLNTGTLSKASLYELVSPVELDGTAPGKRLPRPRLP